MIHGGEKDTRDLRCDIRPKRRISAVSFRGIPMGYRVFNRHAVAANTHSRVRMLKGFVQSGGDSEMLIEARERVNKRYTRYTGSYKWRDKVCVEYRQRWWDAGIIEKGIEVRAKTRGGAEDATPFWGVPSQQQGPLDFGGQDPELAKAALDKSAIVPAARRTMNSRRRVRREVCP